MAREARNHLYVCHVSTEEGVNWIKAAENRGQKVTSEVTPHHLLLNKIHYQKYENRAIMNPPLRDSSGNQALWKG